MTSTETALEDAPQTMNAARSAMKRRRIAATVAAVVATEAAFDAAVDACQIENARIERAAPVERRRAAVATRCAGAEQMVFAL